MPTDLQGIFTPTLVPLDAKGEINEAEMRRFFQWLIAKGVHGLYPNGSTGEFTRFSLEERRRIVKIACEEARGKVPVLAGAAEASAKETLASCEIYAGYGARAVAIVSPYYYRLGAEATYAYFAEIARHAVIDVTLYNIPLFASPIDVPTIQRLAEFPRIVGIKDSSGDISFMTRMVSAVRRVRPDFSFMTGWDAALVPMMMVGASGGTNASSNAIPELTKRIYELCRTRQWEEAMKLQYRIQELFDLALYPFEFPDGFRAAAALRGFDFGHGRMPKTPKLEADTAALEGVVRCVLADFGLIDPPAEGCPPRTGRPNDDKIAQLVFEVLHELEQRGALKR